MASFDGTMAISVTVLLLLAAGAVARARWAMRKYARTATVDSPAGGQPERRAA